mgnify:CR=1 FL=1
MPLVPVDLPQGFAKRIADYLEEAEQHLAFLADLGQVAKTVEHHLLHHVDQFLGMAGYLLRGDELPTSLQSAEAKRLLLVRGNDRSHGPRRFVHAPHPHGDL